MSEVKDTRFLRILKNLDALGCTLIAKRAKAGEYISTYVWRVRKGWAIKLIDKLFKEPGHCEKSFEGQKDALNLVRDDPEEGEQFEYGYMSEKTTRQKFDEESA